MLRELRALGAQLVAVPVAGEGGDSVDFFLGELRTHARENGVAVVAAQQDRPGICRRPRRRELRRELHRFGTGDIVARRTGSEGRA